MRVLLVDDDELSREILEMILGEAGYAVVAVGSGEEARTLLRSGETVAVVLADLKMPGLAGAELAAALREAGAPTLLAMSGSEPGDGTTAGYDLFLLKPFTMDQFADAVRCAQDGAGQGTAAHEVAGLVMTAKVGDEIKGLTAKVLDEVKLASLRVSFTRAQMDELFTFALTDAERQIETMRLAGTAGDDELYRRCAHSMKGSFGMLGAPELRGMAAAAEEDGLRGQSTKVTTPVLFLGALSRLRHTLVSRGICHE